ncbi:hypothetical protein DY023_05810 [Microbacterium bovistercoris]|uniref:ATP synthase protein I n=1 Tax=Microbacterium bovistercoris TaxID=2293570 RepID=A0A371NVH8_9MICO|nr:hypothetical protein [Microbacterium bovistercoris]REJ06613.1 hypothetical protein DY023_05810 [Microbacterium bovistercoris]
MNTPARPTSTPLLRRTLILSAIATGVLAVAGALIGWAVAGQSGLISALVGVLLAAVFLAITAISILIANHWYGDDLYVPIFFGAVLGGWLLKFVIFLVVLATLRGAPWVQPQVFFFAILAGIVVTLIIDVVVMLRTRMPNVSDVELPESTEDPADS